MTEINVPDELTALMTEGHPLGPSSTCKVMHLHKLFEISPLQPHTPRYIL